MATHEDNKMKNEKLLLWNEERDVMFVGKKLDVQDVSTTYSAARPTPTSHVFDDMTV